MDKMDKKAELTQKELNNLAQRLEYLEEALKDKTEQLNRKKEEENLANNWNYKVVLPKCDGKKFALWYSNRAWIFDKIIEDDGSSFARFKCSLTFSYQKEKKDEKGEISLIRTSETSDINTTLPISKIKNYIIDAKTRRLVFAR